MPIEITYFAPLPSSYALWILPLFNVQNIFVEPVDLAGLTLIEGGDL
jgi:hypothetical protein